MITVQVTTQLAFTPEQLSKYATSRDAKWWSGDLDRNKLRNAVARDVVLALMDSYMAEYATVATYHAHVSDGGDAIAGQD